MAGLGPLDLLDTVASADPSPLEDLEAKELRENLSDAIAALPERERTVLALYYREELTMRQIGKTLKLCESRISQIHSQAIVHLRRRLRAVYADRVPARS